MKHFGGSPVRWDLYRASAQISALQRLTGLLDYPSRKAIYTSFIASNFNYCPLVWFFTSRESIGLGNTWSANFLLAVANEAHPRRGFLIATGQFGGSGVILLDLGGDCEEEHPTMDQNSPPGGSAGHDRNCAEQQQVDVSASGLMPGELQDATSMETDPSGLVNDNLSSMLDDISSQGSASSLFGTTQMTGNAQANSTISPEHLQSLSDVNVSQQDEFSLITPAQRGQDKILRSSQGSQDKNIGINMSATISGVISGDNLPATFNGSQPTQPGRGGGLGGTSAFTPGKAGQPAKPVSQFCTVYNAQGPLTTESPEAPSWHSNGLSLWWR